MVSASEIRERLAAFLGGSIDLSAFEDWLVQRTWNVHNSGSVAAEALTFAIEESLAEYSSQHLDSVNLRRELAQILRSENEVVEIFEIPQTVYRFKTSAPLREFSVAR